MWGFVATHLKVDGDGEEDQDHRHPHIPPQQKDLFASVLNYHELQRQNIVSVRPQEGAQVALYRGAALKFKRVQM